MTWNLENIRFLYPPDDFTGKFTNEKMQQRHLAMQKEKISAISSGLENESHPIKAMQVLHRKEYVQFVKNNIDEFKQHSCFEEAVLLLYYAKNTPFAAAGDFSTWSYFFEKCDVTKIYELGKPLPRAKILAFRGSMTGIRKGFSWTTDQKKVAWILDRWQDKSLGGGTVFSLELTREDILVYLDDKDKTEVIVTPSLAADNKAKEITSI